MGTGRIVNWTVWCLNKHRFKVVSAGFETESFRAPIERGIFAGQDLDPILSTQVGHQRLAAKHSDRKLFDSHLECAGKNVVAKLVSGNKYREDG
jgi:hypothetical protein